MSLNWWGSIDLEHDDLGWFGDSFIMEAFLSELNAEFNSWLIVLSTLLILLLYVAAIFLAVTRKWKAAWITGLIAGAVQLLAVIIAALPSSRAEIAYGAGWWLWLPTALITLALSVTLLVVGKAVLDEKLRKARPARPAQPGNQHRHTPSLDYPAPGRHIQWPQPHP